MADGSRSPDAMDLNAIASALGITKRSAERRATKENWPFESRAARGGAKRYYMARSLPADVQAALFLRAGAAVPADAEIERVRRRNTAAATSAAQIQSAWQRYEAVPQHLKDEAARRLRALQAVEQLVADGRPVMDARALIAAQLQRENMRGVSTASLGRWAAQVAGVEKQHRLAMLVPAYTGRTATTEIPAEAWDLFKVDYLRVEAPTAAKCYERLQRIARVKGWSIPSLKTFQRRIQAELPRGVLILARLGQEAFDRTFPAQERDRTVFHALEAVNSDGHKFDVFVRWPDGTVARPIMVGVQDLYSGKLLGWRVAETESADLARFAFRDVIERYGIPAKVWLDNGRGFASKLLTGGTANRFRFKVREDDPTGLLTGMGCEIHWGRRTTARPSRSSAPGATCASPWPSTPRLPAHTPATSPTRSPRTTAAKPSRWTNSCACSTKRSPHTTTASAAAREPRMAAVSTRRSTRAMRSPPSARHRRSNCGRCC